MCGLDCSASEFSDLFSSKAMLAECHLYRIASEQSIPGITKNSRSTTRSLLSTRLLSTTQLGDCSVIFSINTFNGVIGQVHWLLRSPDLVPCDFLLSGHLKNKIDQNRPNSLDDLKIAFREEYLQEFYNELGSCMVQNLVFLNIWFSGLRLTNMTAPVVADTNHDMELNCRFDMESEELYAVKWYKDDHEFFRYMPHQQPHIMSFPVSGVHLALQGTDCDEIHCKVQLTKLTRHHSDGAYRCEVSSEAPTFRLAAETHNITVANVLRNKSKSFNVNLVYFSLYTALPKEKPRITGLEETYNEGDIVSASCTSSPSDPAAIVTWFINNQQVR
ncbi:hypothetical protein FQR65_LT09952 [Abscondita terminalis]|nr:hypothetical protein FQR65_LT09952 [Abscondita terminalis]